MRVLFVTSETGLRGGERQLLLLARELGKLGVEVGLVSPTGAEVAARGRFAFARTASMASDLDIAGAAGVRRAKRDFQPSVTHAFTARAHGIAVLGLVRPLVVQRGVSFPAGKGLLGRLKYARADRYIAVAREAADRLVQAGVPRGAIEIVPNAVEVRATDRERARAALGLGPGRWVGSVAFFEKGKALDDLVRAMPGIDAGLCLVGEGPEGKRLEVLARDLCVRANFAGRRDDAADLVAAFDVFVLPSRAEGLPVVLLEAAAANVPAVATAVGGVPDFFGPESAWLVEAGDVGALGRAMREVLADPEEARRRADRARQVVADRCAPEAVARGVLRVYEAVAA